MSFLTLAFGLGGLAIAFPLIFHLIRRSPRGRQSFSSLMFLEASPPRLTQRSRLDDWLLLLMRVAIISLIALAFMRPFFRTSALLNQGSLVGRQVAVLIDRSASMQREGTWDKAIELAKQTLRDLRSQDDFSLIVFDATPKVLLGFERTRRTSTLEEKREAALALLDTEQPGWNSTDLASALVEVVETLGTAGDDSEAGKSANIVLISDMQNGAVIDPLQSLEWPDNVIVDIQYVAVNQLGNANLRLLNEVASSKKRRVRITNYVGNEAANFQLTWKNSKDSTSPSANEPVRVDVVAGTSRTEELEIPKAGLVDSINLTGDKTGFDNTFYFVQPVQ
ncbi:MAG: BatA domain-containing protein, partial [Pirellulaceae bacterium]